MIDLTKITLKQANKIECALLQLEDDIKKFEECYKSLAEDNTLSDRARETMKSNAEWWHEVHSLIYETERK